jgi:predicted nucleotidyltransferase
MQHRFDTIRKVETTVKKAFGEKYIIRVFGSTCYGADTEASDLDLVVMVGKSLKLPFNLLDKHVGSIASFRLCTALRKREVITPVS